MKSVAMAFVLAVVLVALSFAITSRRSASARSDPPAEAEPIPGGVVCFGTVDLEHGVTSLVPLQPGRVAEVAARENQEVAAGAVLLRLEDGAARSRLAEAEAAVELARLQLSTALKLPDQHHRRIAQQQAAQDAASSRLAAARKAHDQRRTSTQPNLANTIELTTSEGLVCELEALERVEILRLAEMKAQDVESDIRRSEHELASAEARRDQARFALEECRVKAPGPGTVLRVLVGPGDVLGPDRPQPALLFAPDGPQVIRAIVEQEFAPRVKPGEEALIRDEADPAIRIRGRVERLAAWYSPRRAVMHDPSQMSDVRTLECVIVPEPGHGRMRLGQVVRVQIGPVPE